MKDATLSLNPRVGQIVCIPVCAHMGACACMVVSVCTYLYACVCLGRLEIRGSERGPWVEKQNLSWLLWNQNRYVATSTTFRLPQKLSFATQLAFSKQDISWVRCPSVNLSEFLNSCDANPSKLLKTSKTQL